MIQEKLKEIRKQQKKLQKDIAKAIGVTEAAYSNYEQGRTEPDIQKLKMIANFLNVSLDRLLENEQEKKDGITYPQKYIEATEEEKEIINSFRYLSENGKANLKQM